MEDITATRKQLELLKGTLEPQPQPSSAPTVAKP